MARQDLQAAGGAFTSLAALNANFDDLYAYYGVAAGNPFAANLFVDGDYGSDTNDGLTPAKAKQTIQGAINAAAAGDSIYVRAKAMAAGSSDPSSYAETLIIPAGKSRLRLIGIGSGLAQGGQPQIKRTSGTAALLTIRSPGCLIAGLSINGGDSTGGGGILLDDDSGLPAASGGETKSAFGTVIQDCFFKNCRGTAAAATGGAIQWCARGGGWQVRISRCHFFDNRAGLVLLGTADSRPKDIVVEDCTFASSAATNVDVDIYLMAGSGVNGLVIRNCHFATVDLPQYASSPSGPFYVMLTNCTNGLMHHCTFACTGKTFTSTGDAAKIPATVRKSACYQENALIVA